MPSVAIEKDLLMRSIGKAIGEEELENVVFDFGVELDDTYEEDGKIMYKFDVPANRYDLLCLEGFSTALKAYMSVELFRDLNVVEGDVTVFRKKTHEREHIACAIIRGIEFDKNKYESFIAYQDKLHSSIGRNRSLVAIGTHDLSTLKGKITYQSEKLAEIEFVPLRCGADASSVKGTDMENFYSKDKKLSKYFSLLSDSERAVVFKCGSEVMSLPPIINSEKTKISIDTRDVFIEVTGTDLNKVNTTLKYILYNFRGASVESVRIQFEDSKEGHTLITPIFNNAKYEISLEQISKKVDLKLTAQEAKALLERMLYKVEINGSKLNVHVYDVRSDVLHECDVLEDIAIAYGFNNFEYRCPAIYTVGCETRMNKFSDKIRQELAIFGFIEVLTLTLLSKAENVIDADSAVVLENPKSKEYEVVRTSLLPGILKSVASNLHAKIPIKVFEVADVVLLDENADEGARNERRVCCVLASNRSLLEDVQGPLSMLFEKCGISNFSYELSSDERYLENQNAVVKIGDQAVGTMGVLHPSICKQFEIPYAASSFEIDLELLFNHFISK